MLMGRPVAAVALAAGVLVGTSAFSVKRDQESPSLLNTPLVGFTASSLTRVKIVERIRDVTGVPVSLVDGPDSCITSVNASARSLREILDQIVASNPGYCWRCLNGHVLIRPKVSILDDVERGVSIVNEPRPRAEGDYVTSRLRIMPGYAGRVALIECGFCTDRMFERVTLARVDTAINHLVQLLGADKSVAFILHTGRSGQTSMQLYEGNVKASAQKD
jgi:hypothetical protein